MAKYELGDLRRSSVIMNAAPGAVVDFRADGAPISAVIAGQDAWDRFFPPVGLANPQVIYEERLQKKLKVEGFRLPPVRPSDEIKTSKEKGWNPRALAAVRFPNWLQCPQCNKIAPAEKWGEEPGRAWKKCSLCSVEAGGPVYVVPVRFVMACANGHLDEFPWHYWVEHKISNCSGDNGFLKLKSEGPGLAGLVLSCPKCHSSKSLEGIFSKTTWERIKLKCRGKRPWLGDLDPKKCELVPRVMQRGASNMYFPVMETALSIPPWSNRLPEEIGQFWGAIVNVEDTGGRIKLIEQLEVAGLKDVMKSLGLTRECLAQQVEDYKQLLSSANTDNLRIDEYRQFSCGATSPQDETQNFEMRREEVPRNMTKYFDQIVRLVRLREVRALKGFTRIFPAGEGGLNIAPIASDKKQWLPAIEVKGEGIYISFHSDTLSAWEKSAMAVKRAQEVQSMYMRQWKEMHDDEESDQIITPRFLLIHTFAHVLMKQLTMECGYSSAALRERLYVDQDNMAGVLIYTSTSDADGTLGGLQRQGKSEKIGNIVESAIKSIAWCSSDPLCIEGLMCGVDSLSLAACHSCVLAPETSCEEFNRFLDRALLVGLPVDPDLGFFSDIMRAG
jgi:hypothetical protein